MQRMKIIRIYIALGFLSACAMSENPTTSEQEQAEILEVHGCRPGLLQVGDECVDPRGGGGGGPGPTGGERGPTDGGGGGGGGGGADPNPIPTPRDCTVETDHEACMQCCDWNVDNVWGERCRRIPRKERRTCWEDAEMRRGVCQRGCPRPILTVTP